MIADGASLIDLLLIGGIIAAAGLVHGTLGLGFPLVSTPLLALFMDVRSAILITLLPTATVNIASMLRGGEWRHSIGQFWPLALYGALGCVVGTSFIIVNDPGPFKLVLALLIFLYLGSGWLGGYKMRWVERHRGWSMLVFGLIAGVAAGSTNVMVPILIVYTLELGLTATAMVQVFNMCFLASKIVQMVMFGVSGLFALDLFVSTAPLAILALLVLFAGMTIRDRIPGDTFRSLTKGMLFIVALILVGQYFL